MNPQEKLQLVGETLTAFSALYTEQLRAAREELGLPENWFLIWTTMEYEPDTISPRKAHTRTPYANIANFERLDRELVEQGILVDQGDQEYVVEPNIRAKMKKLIRVIEDAVAEIEVLSFDELYRLETRLNKVIKAAISSKTVDAYATRLNHNSNPSISAPSILKIFQYLTDLGTWRDDAHIAAWKHHNIPGNEWEVLGFIWEGEKTNAALILEVRQGRGYTVEDYQAAIESLIKRGWVEADPEKEGHYRVTPTGRKLRDEAEVATDRNYFSPFEVLGKEAAEETWESLLHLRDALRELAPAPQPA